MGILRIRHQFPTPRGPTGITESFWAGMNQDRRFYWALASQCIALATGFMIARTGVRLVDALVAFIGTRLAGAVIDNQRNYGKSGARTRKGIVRIAVGVGSYGFMLLGVALFASVGAGVIATTFFAALLPVAQEAAGALGRAAMLVASTVVCLSAVIWVFRQLQFEELIKVFPRRGITNVLVYRPFRAATFEAFAAFELAVLLVGVLLASLFGTVVSSLVLVLHQPYP